MFQLFDDLYGPRFRSLHTRSSLTLDDVQPSRDLFISDSLSILRPKPKDLDLICLVVGLPLYADLISYAANIQDDISALLDDTLAYLVKPQSLAIEVCVLKWHTDQTCHVNLAEFIEFLDSYHFESFKAIFNGFQFHSDGAIVLRGIETSGLLATLRSEITHLFPRIPKIQSKWFHVPLGRILDSVPERTFMSLKDKCVESHSRFSKEFSINRLHLVHEHSWYQTNYTTLALKDGII